MSADDVARYRYCNNGFSGTVSRIGILRDEQRLTVIIRSMEFPFASIFKLWMASQLVSGLQLIKPYTSISVACTLKCQELKGKTYAYSVHTALAKDCLSEQGSCGDWGSIEDMCFFLWIVVETLQIDESIQVTGYRLHRSVQCLHTWHADVWLIPAINLRVQNSKVISTAMWCPCLRVNRHSPVTLHSGGWLKMLKTRSMRWSCDCTIFTQI